MLSDSVIKVENLSKCYQIYEQPHDRLKQFVLPKVYRLARLEPKTYFREFWALSDVSFEVKKGETIGIIGRNGSGKSTLLQMICGTLNPTNGNIQTRGRVAALLELGSGFNPEFTGRENIYMNGALLGLNQGAIDERFEQIAAFADIGDFIEQPVKNYSSGMVVRLAFAVIAHVDADILVIDEALAVGDVFFTQKCMRFLRSFMKQGTVFFVSHDTSAVTSLCDRAVFLEQGRVQMIGSPKSVVEQYMTKLYQDNQAIDGILIQEGLPKQTSTLEELDLRDMRMDLINSSHLRNDIEVFVFNSQGSEFGTGDARIISVRLLDCERVPLSWIIGGEEVILEIECHAHCNLYSPIVGFYINNHLGQTLFCDNTYLVYREQPQAVSAGGKLTARFLFNLPLLPSGDYVISAALADGTQEEHIQHHWIHDALAFRAHASVVRFGLIGIPMKSISLESC